MQLARRVGTTLLVALLIAMVAASSAQACGCGAFVCTSILQAVQGTALVTVDGTSQSITMNIATQTAVQVQEVAFVMPLPARANFALADSKLFTELDQFSKPTVEVDVVKDLEILGLGGGGSGDDATAGAAPGGATVLDQITSARTTSYSSPVRSTPWSSGSGTTASPPHRDSFSSAAVVYR